MLCSCKSKCVSGLTTCVFLAGVAEPARNPGKTTCSSSFSPPEFCPYSLFVQVSLSEDFAASYVFASELSCVFEAYIVARRGHAEGFVLEKIRSFPEMGVPPNGLFIAENPIKMDDLT